LCPPRNALHESRQPERGQLENPQRADAPLPPVAEDAPPRRVKVPTFQFRGNTANPGKKEEVGLMFYEGANLPGRHPLMTGDGEHVRTMRFADFAAVEKGHKAIEAAIRAWCRWKADRWQKSEIGGWNLEIRRSVLSSDI
jgi:hypothetical protein